MLNFAISGAYAITIKKNPLASVNDMDNISHCHLKEIVPVEAKRRKTEASHFILWYFFSLFGSRLKLG